ncbi:hypothetical protein C8T65DRAFT_629282 [Cerioporus squamosus]|nr:hypothetical protein C8T65DRAFT_629282 [Cerioporus squamosus]
MQSLPPESLVRDVDISVSPNKTEARAYTHSPQPRQKPADLPSILQIPQAAQQEPSTVSFATSSATLPLVGPSSARCEDIAEEKSLAQVPTAISSSAGPLTSSALHELLLELEMDCAHGRPLGRGAVGTDDMENLAVVSYSRRGWHTAYEAFREGRLPSSRPRVPYEVLRGLGHRIADPSPPSCTYPGPDFSLRSCCTSFH